MRARRESASPKWSSFMPIRSMIERYRLQIFRLIVSGQIDQRAPRLERAAETACEHHWQPRVVVLTPTYIFESHIRQQLSSTVPSPSGILSSFVAR